MRVFSLAAVALFVVSGCYGPAYMARVAASRQHRCPERQVRLERRVSEEEFWLNVCGRSRLYEIRDGRARDISGSLEQITGVQASAATPAQPRYMTESEREDVRSARARAARCANTRCVRAGGARFAGESLQECVDVELAGDAVQEQDARARVGEGYVRTHRACAQQFANRQPLATCTVERQVDALVERVSRRFYRYDESNASDAMAQACLSNGGEWSTIAEGSEALDAARIDWEARQLQQEAQRLQDAGPTDAGT